MDMLSHTKKVSILPKGCITQWRSSCIVLGCLGDKCHQSSALSSKSGPRIYLDRRAWGFLPQMARPVEMQFLERIKMVLLLSNQFLSYT